MASPSASRDGFIDAVRGVAACVVMLQHALSSSGRIGKWPQETLTGFNPNFLQPGVTGVVAFFMVSGFVRPLRRQRWRRAAP